MKPDKTIYEITIMRVVAMIMIIAFHSVCFYGGRWPHLGAVDIPFWKNVMLILDAIDLNMFVFISGYLFGFLHLYKDKYHDRSLILKNKCIRLLIPYVFWGVFMVLAFPSLYHWHNFFYGIAHLWFLLMLFGVFVLSILLVVFKIERLSYLGIVLVVLMSFSFFTFFRKYISSSDFLCSSKVLYYFTAFLIGYFCASQKVIKHSGKKMIPVLLLSLMLLVTYILVNPQIPYLDNRFCLTFLSYVICLSTLVILNRVQLKGLLRTVVLSVGELSMGIYIFNQIAMDVVLTNTTLNEWFREHWMVGPFLLFLIGFFPPLLLASVFNRYKVLRWTIGG